LTVVAATLTAALAALAATLATDTTTQPDKGSTNNSNTIERSFRMAQV
jgi:hypothetical protein